MDRVVLRKDDMPTLLDWYNKNIEWVSQLPAPLKTVEISFNYNDYRVKGIRLDKKLMLYLYYGNTKLGKVVFDIDADKVMTYEVVKGQVSQERLRSMVILYCTIMAYMVYEKPKIAISNEPPALKEKKSKHHKKSVGKNRATYILRQSAEKQISHGGHHASPKGVFTVRGHYRHLKSGKTVWISEYQKGKGDKKSKTYKMGGTKNESKH